MIELLKNKKEELLKKLADLDLAKKPIEAKIAVIDELIKEEESKIPVAETEAVTEKPVFDPLEMQKDSTVFISYSNDLG